MKSILSRDMIREIVERALKEDVGNGDITTSLIDEILPPVSEAFIICEENCVLAGLPFARECFGIQGNITVKELKGEGDNVEKGEKVMEVRGDPRAILTAERTALNFLMHLSGIATETRKLVNAAGGKVKILDTRKTTPLLRLAEKYAVSVGGGFNHRMGLYDGILVKDNHKKLAGSLSRIIKKIKDSKPHYLLIEVEVSSFEELKEVIEEGGVDALLLDNMSPDEVRKCLQVIPKNITVEVSGNINASNISSYLLEGVNFISSGYITHSSRSIPFSLEFK